MTDDLTVDAVRTALGDRPARVYPAVLSTEADAQAWARAGARDGAVVTASYQAAPRGRAGLPWAPDPSADLVFSLVVRPALTPEREGWLYTSAAAGLLDAIGGDAQWHWPDAIHVGGAVVARIGIHAELGSTGVEWAAVTVLWHRPAAGRPQALAAAVAAIEQARARDPIDVLDDLRPACATLGDGVRALLIPMGPAGPRVEGTASDLRDDGSLVIATPAGGRIAVRPQHLGLLEPFDDAAGSGDGR